jgi:GAF domain-containing protein/response regulator RpfG family c-di-GMP phosphodiesterase
MTTRQNNVQIARQRLVRRVAPMVVLAFVLVGVFGMFSIRGVANDTLRATHRLIMNDLTNQIKTEFDKVSDDLTTLARESSVRAFASDTEFSLGVREPMIRRFLDWIETHQNEYLTLRYLDSEGRVRAAVANTQSGSQIVNQNDTVPEPLWGDTLNGPAGQIFIISPLTVQAVLNSISLPNFFVSTPVYANTGAANALGVLQVEINAYTVLDAVVNAETSAVMGAPGRRVVILNNAGKFVADSESDDLSQVFTNITGAGREFTPTRTGRATSVDQLLDQFFKFNTGALELVGVGNLLVSVQRTSFLSAPDMPWRIVVIDDANQVFSATNTEMLIILGASIIVGLGVATGLIAIVGRVLTPFERAAALAQQLAADQAGVPEMTGAQDPLIQAVMQMSGRVQGLAEEMENQRQRIKGNLQIATRISREAALQAGLDELMNRVINLICGEYQFHHAQVFMLDDVSQNAVLAYSYGKAGQALLQQGLKVPVLEDSIISRAIMQRRVFVDHTSDAVRASGALPDTQARLVLPLFTGETLFGVLDIQSTDGSAFQEGEAQAFELLADRISSAVYNVRLLEQSEERVQEINSLNRELTRTAWEGVQEKFQVEQGYYYDLHQLKPGTADYTNGEAMSLPITIRGQVIGSLDVAVPEGGEFSADEQLILNAVTDRVALAIDRARLFQETQLSLSETSLLYELSRHINEATALEEIIQAMITSVMPDAMGGQVMEFDDYRAGGAPEWMTVTADWFAPTHSRAHESLHGLRLHLPDHRFSTGLSGSEVTLIGDLEAEPNIDDFLREILRSVGAHALVVIPLTIRGQWRGSVAIEFPEPRRFSPQDRRIFTALIDQASVAIDNSLLLRQTAAALEETSRLYAASRAISSAPNLNLVYTAAAEHLAEASNATRQILLLLSVPERKPDAPYLEYGYVWRWGTDDHAPMGKLVQRESVPYTRLANSDGSVRLVHNVMDELADQPAILSALRQANVASLVVSPLRLRQKWFGLLVCASDQASAFDAQYSQFVRTVADQVAIAVENYDLIKAAESERERMSSILESMPSGVLVLDAKTYLPLQTNQQIERLLGQPISMTEPFSAAYYNLFRTGTQLHYADEELPIFLAAQMGDLMFADDIVAVHRDGTQMDLLLNAAPIREPDGTISMIVAAFENISSLRGLENALQDNLRETIAMYEATRALAEADQVDDVLNVILMQIAVIEPHDAAVVLLDESTEQRIVARTLVMPPETFDLPSVVFRHRGPVWISDVAGDHALTEEIQADLLAHGIHAIGTMPLRARAREMPLAWMVISYGEPHPFSSEDERYLTTLADGAATSLDNRYLFQRTESALQEASILYRASRALAEGSTQQDILRTVIDHLLHDDVTQVFIIMLASTRWDEPGALASVVASWTRDNAGIDLQGVTLSADQFPAWNLLSASELKVIENLDEYTDLDDLERMGVESLGAQSLVIMPLRASNRPIGAIWMGSDVPHKYSESDLRIYQAFSEQTSISLEAERLYDQAERRAAQLQTSAQVSQFASSVLDLDILLPRLVDLIKSAFNYDHVQIFLMDREDRYAMLRASTGDAGRQLLAINHKLERGSASVIGTVTAENRPVVAADTGMADVIHKPNPYLPHTRSEMALPLVIKGKVVGALDVQSNQPNTFTDEDVAVLTTLAAQISVAIDNARLFEQAERRASDMSLLFAVTTAAASAESLSDALQNVANDLRDSLNALSIGIFLPVEYVDEVNNNRLVTMRAAAAAGYHLPLSTIVEIRVGDPTNVIGLAAEITRSRIINRISDESLYIPLVASAQSAVIVPLTSAGQIVGLITMENAQPYAYNHETLTLLQTMGGTLTALIQNQQLLERLQQTNEQLLEIDRLKSEFLANMSHELRTPLNSIIGFSRVILKGIDGPLTEMQEQDLTTIYNSGQHLLNLINDILDQAKIAAGKMEIKPDYFDIKPVVEGVRSIGIGLVKDKPIEIKIDIESGLPHVYGDEFRTRQVLLNLLSNAAKFTQQGSITVSVYRSQHSQTHQPVIRVDVADTGIGIGEKDIPLLFEAFRQIDSSLTRTAGGTGLGLPISKSLIEMQGGEMFVSSKVNVGSIFSVTIPLEPGEIHKGDTGQLPEVMAETNHAADTLPMENGSKKSAELDAKHRTAMMPAVMAPKRQVLLIEDNPDRVDQFRRTIQREGFDVFSASIPLEAEAMASGLRPSIIVMDVDFADGMGWEILRKLKERDDTFDIPLIVVTLSDEAERALEAGAFAFLQHPIVPDDLVRVLLDAENESNTQRILIIDDQPESTRLLTQLLDEHGNFRVFAAHNGIEGVSMVARRRPDLVILDLRMPEKDGFAVLEELRSNPETSNIPVLIVTGDSLNADEQNLLHGVEVMYKTNISLEDCKQFIQDVQMHLSRNGE